MEINLALKYECSKFVKTTPTEEVQFLDSFTPFLGL